MTFTRSQVDALLRGIKPHRVANNRGQSYVEAYEITAHLIRIFGFGGWRKEILELTCVHDHCDPQATDKYNKVRPGWTVVYRCQMRLSVEAADGRRWFTEDVATGDASNQVSPGAAHDMAAKTAVSQALKRCAKDLGDQFGLSLYSGRTSPIVGMTLVMPNGQAGAGDPEDHAPESTPEQMNPLGPDTDADASGFVDRGTGEAFDPDGWPDAPGPGEELVLTPAPPERTVEDVHTDLGGQLPATSVKEQIDEARGKVDATPDMMRSNTRRSIHTDAKLLGHEGNEGHEWARAEGNRALGQPEDTSMETWTKDQGDVVLKHLNAMVKEARR